MRVMEILHIEVRKKIVTAREQGLSVQEICKAYSIGKTAVYRLLSKKRNTGNIAPQTHLRGRKSRLDKVQIQAIKELIDTRKDITIPEIREELQVPLCDTAIGNIIRNKLGYRYKTTCRAALHRDE